VHIACCAETSVMVSASRCFSSMCIFTVYQVPNGRNSVFEGMEAACRDRLPIHPFHSLSYDRSVECDFVFPISDVQATARKLR